ncbi:MAG: hypothetical protein M1483_01745 [Actinobacteria bacterium]|nr:hypothetical protein [Actinomycetota bacterium]MCL6104353.1 hypothetical protein [Actinomycetota bacterium]
MTLSINSKSTTTNRSGLDFGINRLKRFIVLLASIVMLATTSLVTIMTAVTPASAAGTTVMTWSSPQNIDPNINANGGSLPSISCASSSFCVTTDLSGNVYTYNGTAWSSPQNIDPNGGGITSISCATTTFCVAVDAKDNADVGYGTSWPPPTSIDGSGYALTSVSCASPSFCVAVDASGNEVTYNGTTWSSPQNISSNKPLASVSCASSSFCVAVDSSGNEVTYNGSGWSSPVSIDPSGGGLTSVSCASSSFCVAVDSSGNEVTYNGTTWSSSPQQIDTNPKPYNSINSVSCPLTSYCVAVDTSGYGFTYNGTTWSSQSIYPVNLNSVSCTSTTFCATVGSSVNTLFYNGSSWSPSLVGALYTNGLTSVSCTTSTFCVATDNTGNFLIYNGISWSKAQQVDPTHSSATYVSCLSTTFCMAVNTYGDGLTYNGTSWSATNFDTTGSPNFVSCASTTFCAAVDNGGNAFTWNGTSWSMQNIDSNNQLHSVSCVSSTFCVAADNGPSGTVFIYNGTTWSAPDAIDTNGDIDSVSCISAGFCIAVDFAGNEMTYNGSGWSPPQSIDTVDNLISVSCVSTTFCEAVDYTNALTYNGTSWSAPHSIDTSASPNSVSCATASFCAAVDTSGNVLLGTTPSISGPLLLTSLSSSNGPGTGGNSITLNGTGFSTTGGSGATSVSFGGIAASGVTCSTTTSCSATVPVPPSGVTLPYTVKVTASVSNVTSDWTAYTYLPASAATGTAYNPLTPYRVCDTRSGNPSKLGSAGTDLTACGGLTLGANGNSSTLTIPIAGTYSDTTSAGPNASDGVPSSASSVILNVTAINPSAAGFLTVWPAGQPRPTASSLNYAKGTVVPNLVEVTLGSTSSCTGCISIYSYAISDVVIDVEGYVGSPGGSTFTPITPYRVCDTRSGDPSQLSGSNLSNCQGKTLTGGTTLNVKVAPSSSCTISSCSGTGGVPASATAVVLNVTAISPTNPGYLTVWPESSSKPVVSNLNFISGETVPNAVIVPVSSGSQPGMISIYNFAGSTNVAVDVTGYFSASGSSFVGTTPYRVCDSRGISAVGYATPCSGTSLLSSAPLTLNLAGVGPIPSNATAVVLNVTAVSPTNSGYLTVWPESAAQPVVSNLNFTSGNVIANSVTVGLGSTGKINIALYAGSTNVIVDVVGWFT